MKLTTHTFFRAFIFCSAATLWMSCQKTEDISSGTVTDDIFTGYFRRTQGWVAGDGGYSIRLIDGKNLWLWGDSHIDDYDPNTETVPCLFQVNNAGLLQSEANPAVMNTLTGNGNPASYFVHPGGWPDYWFWPLSGYQFQDTIYVMLDNIKKTGSGGSFGFTSGGPDYMAKIAFPSMQVSEYMQLPAQNDITFGMGFIQHEGYMYVYGNKKTSLVGTSAYVARFYPDNPIQSWRYFNGSEWVINPQQADEIASDGDATFSSAFKVGNTFVLLSTEFSLDCTGRHIYAYTAKNPQGPYSGRKIIYSLPDTLGGTFPFFYIAVGHPQFTNAQGVLVTYSVNGFLDCGPETCVNNRLNPDFYRPRAIRVPVSTLDTE